MSSCALEIKGDLFTLTVLRILHSDIDAIERELTAKLKQAPAFFKRAPVVVDLQMVARLEEVNESFLRLLTDRLRHYQLVVVGLYNASMKQRQAGEQIGLSTFWDQPEFSKSSPEPILQAPPVVWHSSRVVFHPVRSGQQIYAKDSDLVLLGPVSAGAEVLSDGHIHVYAPLRGRALAGIQGDVTASIFCRQFEAELVGIAGYYRLFEDRAESFLGKSVHILLDGEQLIVKPLG